MTVMVTLQNIVEVLRSPTDQARAAGVSGVASTAAQPVDAVELGAAAERIVADAEQQRIAEVRAQIAAGTYLTDDKLDYVAGRLRDVLQQDTVPHTALSA